MMSFRICSVLYLIPKEIMTNNPENHLKKSHNSDTFDSFDYEGNSVLHKYKKYAFTPQDQDLNMAP
jgi:hypothetical protein